jgi:hypothetical protein
LLESEVIELDGEPLELEPHDLLSSGGGVRAPHIRSAETSKGSSSSAMYGARIDISSSSLASVGGGPNATEEGESAESLQSEGILPPSGLCTTNAGLI